MNDVVTVLHAVNRNDSINESWMAPASISRLARVTAALVLLSTLVPAATAQTPEDLILKAADGWPVHVSYFGAKRGKVNKESPIVVLLTAANGDEAGVTRRVWKNLAVHLQSRRFAVLSVDLRKHGDSLSDDDSRRVKTADYRNMVLYDMEAVKAFLLERHQEEQLNIRKLGIVTSGSSAMVAAAFAMNDWMKPPYPDAPTVADRTPRGQDVRAIVMISPHRTKGMNPSPIMQPLADPRMGIAIRIYHSSRKGDTSEQKFASQLYRMVKLKGDEYQDLRSIEARPASAEGFLRGRVAAGFQTELTEFLQTNLDDLVSPWTTRISKIDR